MFNFKYYFKKQVIDFQKYGWAGVFTKIKNRLIYPILKIRIKKILKTAKNYHRKSILIVNGAEKSVSEIHRVKHLEDKLKILNIPFLSLTDNLLNRFTPRNINKFNLLYIHRCPYKNNIITLINDFKNQHKLVIYDIDDLIFDKDQLKKISFLKNMNSRFCHQFIQNTDVHLKIMKRCDFTITPTKFLSQYINKKYKIHTKVLRNHLDQSSLDKGRKIYQAQKQSQNKNITIGYFSGTKTHDKDFQIIQPSLQKLLTQNPNLNLKIVGILDINSSLNKFKNQIITHKKVPYKRLMNLYKGVDINIAPLEINNDFCESKSELKYFFAAACGIPTVASATDAFKHAIKQGENGYLCKNSSDWYQYLNRLIQNKKERLVMGKKAFIQTKQEYSPKYQAKQLKKILEEVKFYD